MLTRLKRLFRRLTLRVPPTPLDEHGVTEARSVSTMLSLSGGTWLHDHA